jgi:hypothetical protein
VSTSVVKCSWVKCSGVLQCSFSSFFDRFVYDCMFCIFLLNSISYIFLLLCLCILIDMYALFCIFFANWHSPATLTQVFLCFFLSCKANVRVYLAKTGHGPHSSKLVNFLFYIFFGDCVVLCFVLCRLCCSMYCLCRLCCSMYCLCRLGCFLVCFWWIVWF